MSPVKKYVSTNTIKFSTYAKYACFQSMEVVHLRKIKTFVMSDEKLTVHQISEEKNGQISNFFLDGETILNVDHSTRIVSTSNQQSRKFETADELENWISMFTRCVLRKRKAYRPEFANTIIVDECFLESKRASN